MSTKTYSEQRQAVLFKASRDIRKIAADVLDDVQNEVELTSFTTIKWALETAARTARQANELEDIGHEIAVATPLHNTLLFKSRNAYSKAFERFEKRVVAASTGGGELLDQVHAEIRLERERRERLAQRDADLFVNAR